VAIALRFDSGFMRLLARIAFMRPCARRRPEPSFAWYLRAFAWVWCPCALLRLLFFDLVERVEPALDPIEGGGGADAS
jgi:hypothetical protein